MIYFFRGPNLLRAIEIRRKLAPQSLRLAGSLNGLGMVIQERGYLKRAEDHFLQSIHIFENLAPDSLDLSHPLHNLGTLAYQRDDQETARALFEKAWKIRQSQAPGSLHEAYSLNHLGNVALESGQLKEAEQFYRHALEIRQRKSPESVLISFAYNNLGVVAMEQGDLAEAQTFFEQALELKQKHLPSSLIEASTLHSLGRLAARRGDLDTAFERLLQTLEIRQELHPNSLEEAETLYDLAKLHLRRANLEQADKDFDRAIESFEAGMAHLGGSSETRRDFRAKRQHLYKQAIRLQLELGKIGKAFFTLERSRGQSFLALLVERDLIFTADLPEALEDTRRRNAALHDRTLREMSDQSLDKNPERIENLRRRLGELNQEHQEIQAAIRRSSPRLASLQQPSPLDAESLRQALDPGTLMLSYSVHEEAIYLFTLGHSTLGHGTLGNSTLEDRAELIVKTLPIDEETLHQEIVALHSLIHAARSGTERGAVTIGGVISAARRLFTTLIEPVADQIEQSERLLIIPDGPLHLLPFGALMRETETTQEFLIEWRPLHFALSGTVHAELKKMREIPKTDAPTVIAFGDPLFTQQETALEKPEARPVVELGHQFDSLPASRLEVEKISALFPDAQTYLGSEATEERARSIHPGPRYLHFATHGVLDERSPLDSALVFSLPKLDEKEREDGLLQAWEIFERVRLDSDLVVLSACESGLGKEVAGEGLIGLMRAFHYAGARSVVASSWEVRDWTTAELMSRFYSYLKEGFSKDEALRHAQIELIRTPLKKKGEDGDETVDASAPYFWAAFQLNGDWR